MAVAAATQSADRTERTKTERTEADSLLSRLDRWCERIGDALNPILVKETRQALKSRQFAVTFSALMFAALAWTIIGSLSMMPEIYTSASAPRMLVGYYLVLALPMLIVVPLAAYRSLEGEIDDGTLELLSITVLSPGQIVLGKLASAMLQMLLYFVVLFPCVAYAYTLRGVDLPTTLLMMAILLVSGIVLTVVALFFAPLSRSRTGRIGTLMAVMSILLMAEWGLALLVINMILQGNPLSADALFFAVVATLSISGSLAYLLLTAAAAQLTPETENRSTKLRLSMMGMTAVLMAVATLGIRMFPAGSEAMIVLLMLALAGLWTVCSAMIVAESEHITPRIRRELPSSFMARAMLTWLTPGPVSGLVFAVACITVCTASLVWGIGYAFESSPSRVPAKIPPALQQLSVAYAGYLVLFLVAVRWITWAIRRRSRPRVESGLATLVAVAVLASLVPYSIGLHMNDYRAYKYSLWQITNWAWGMSEILSQANSDASVSLVLAGATLAFFATVLMSPSLVLPRRTATPERVRRARRGVGERISS